ncbi:hypothetical protein BO82DRAFT_404569 [Aspergillus uvarum CBS 121591]|uniref:Uncharacterized protein n=1 Tax=Aspergillus uvarum CBS 121591 TaxID=1448315 RepID=A0A319C1Z7_9EURO|nr:hypothetical protein BO82DRAFT_404569 [Aspergillus uvarum CBS 121591]PYH79114.1 hypothetical protein BO82DRAFT_404569 [Aspergillus uvarum CBS 121591]
MGRIPFVTSPLSGRSTPQGSTFDSELGLATHNETLFENPQFERYEATSNIQLFFDLFFVANLTSFVTAHDVNSSKTLASYVGFISILWFTWCQVTLYDVRFATDSIFERVAHGCHFGVMMGLAVIGPNFLKEEAWGPMQQLSLILMVSRLVLACQYGTTLYFTWQYRKIRAPLLTTLISLLAAAAVYFGISSFSTWSWPAIMETVTIVHNFGWNIPKEVAAKANLTIQEEIDAVMKVYDLTFGYFCICTGLFLIFTTVLRDSIASSRPSAFSHAPRLHGHHRARGPRPGAAQSHEYHRKEPGSRPVAVDTPGASAVNALL